MLSQASYIRGIILLTILVTVTIPVNGQDWGMSNVRTNVFLQTVGRFQPILPDDGATVNTISVPRARVRARGQHETGLSFDLQADVVRSPALLDARISFPLTERIIVDTGLFKAPFSGEFLDPIQGLDMVDRSRVVRAMAPQRQVGLMLRNTPAASGLSTHVGLFNGNGIAPRGNDDNSFMAAGRLGWSNDRIRIGANAAKEADMEALLGADVRYTPESWILSGEIIHQESVRTGWHATAGRSFNDRRHEALIRWDRMADDDNLLLAGYTFRPVTGVTFQANWALPLEMTRNHGFSANLQWIL